jgi:hypothetical protein
MTTLEQHEALLHNEILSNADDSTEGTVRSKSVPRSERHTIVNR